MKKFYVLIVLIVLGLASIDAKAQMSTGVDLYSSYVWRGAKFGNGPAVQPWLDYTTGGLSLGAWGSVCVSDNEGYEMDLYASYSFDFGLGITLTDYYFGGPYFDGAMHFLEPSISFETGGLSLTGAYMIGDGISDTYLEAGYSFGALDVFVGAGDGQYTSDGGFMLCNVGLGTSKEIKLSESFSLPVSGSVILNPSTEAFFIVVGISL
ncbi:TorF family putative porin [Roseimarinus sediminis]|jgi:hypothetical protein|uniref:TorF family putative porin n=1 Tax=Roseimarinus sediminis TaxID=1610899 RepID=UPI003D263F0F